SKVHQNIAVVGDDAQSIYAFRGANIQNILNFEKDYPELKVIKLEQNYRSTKNIVNAANSIIAKNTAQLPKNVWTDNLEGDLVEIVKTTSDNEEGKIVASQIFEEKNNHQLSYDDFAVLYRTNSQSRAIEEALRRSNIPYVIIGGVSFYQRREIKDLLGYLRFVVNPLDEQAFRRIVNLPKRGVGATSVDKIVNASFDNNRPLWDVVSNVHAYMSGRAANSVASFAEMIGNFRGMTERKDAFEMASHIAKVSGLLRELYEDKTVEGLNRYENVQELLNAIKEYVDNPENEDKSLGAFLQEVALLTDADNKKKQDDGLPKVTLMTIHMAKGLEFKNVFVVGLEEDLFPSQMMLESRADLEEERRLFYVAITRAMNKLFLTYALSRYRFGRLKNCEPSRFLEEIDPAYVRINRRSSSVSPAGMLRRGGSLPGGTNAGSEFQGSNYARNLVRGTQLDKKNSQNARQTNRQVYKPSPGFAPSDTTDLKEGQRVEHAKFGMGTVTKMDTTGANRKASVLFENAGEKTLLLSFAKLRIVE
ncbi:MAG: 3'-5' exonuclease, partial [Cyclobacteriaceae bacterium]